MFNHPFLLENRTSLKLVQKVSNCYKPIFKNYYFDRFGILDSGTKYFDFPTEDHTDFIEACLERAYELSKIQNLRIAFSGGVDTTFLLALFKVVGKDVRLIHYVNPETSKIKDAKFYVSKKILKFVQDNYDFVITNNRYEPIFDGFTYTACLADGLFFPTQAVKGGWEYFYEKGGNNKNSVFISQDKFYEWQICASAKLPDLSIDKWCRMRGNGRINRNPYTDERDRFREIPQNIDFSEEEIKKFKNYASMFGKSMNSNWSIVRLINFSFCYYQFLFEHPFKDNEHTKSFFDTQKFTNMAWTQYWNANKFYPPDKSVEYKFIRKVFGTDFGVRKNW